MDLASHSLGTPSHVCSDCERSFAGPGPLNFHRRSCKTTKRRLQGVLAKAKEQWEAKKRSKRHPPDEPQHEVAISNTADLLTQAQGPLLAAATPTASPSGGNVTLPCMAEDGGLSIPIASAPIQMDLAGIGDTVCGQPARVVHRTDPNRLQPRWRWTLPLAALRAFLWRNEEPGVRADSFRFDTGMSLQKLFHHSHHPHCQVPSFYSDGAIY